MGPPLYYSTQTILDIISNTPPCDNYWKYSNIAISCKEKIVGERFDGYW